MTISRFGVALEMTIGKFGMALEMTISRFGVGSVERVVAITAG